MSSIQLSRCEHEIEAEGAEFRGSRFTEVSLQDARFEMVTFANAQFEKVTFEACRFDEVRFDGAAFGKASFKNVALAAHHLEGLTIEGVSAAELLDAWRAAHP